MRRLTDSTKRVNSGPKSGSRLWVECLPYLERHNSHPTQRQILPFYHEPFLPRRILSDSVYASPFDETLQIMSRVTQRRTSTI